MGFMRYRRRFARHLVAGVLAGGMLLAGAGQALAQTPFEGALEDPNVVPIQGNLFLSDERIVPAGTTLAWVNLDPEDHDIVANDFAFESPIIGPGQVWSYTFDAPGIYAYLCDLHANMEGVVVVVEPEATEMEDSAPMASVASDELAESH